jgi:hypothetical protein
MKDWRSVTRPWIATLGVLAALLLLPATAAAAWSGPKQVIGFLSEGRPAIGVDEAGTVAVGLGVNPASYVERPAGLAAWNSTGVKITQITGAPPSTVFALSSSGAAVAAWATGSSTGPEALGRLQARRRKMGRGVPARHGALVRSADPADRPGWARRGRLGAQNGWRHAPAEHAEPGRLLGSFSVLASLADQTRGHHDAAAAR